MGVPKPADPKFIRERIFQAFFLCFQEIVYFLKLVCIGSMQMLEIMDFDVKYMDLSSNPRSSTDPEPTPKLL